MVFEYRPIYTSPEWKVSLRFISIKCYNAYRKKTKQKQTAEQREAGEGLMVEVVQRAGHRMKTPLTVNEGGFLSRAI